MSYIAEVKGTNLRISSTTSKFVYENNYPGEILRNFDFADINNFPIVEDEGAYLYVKVQQIFLMLPTIK